jgi:UDP-glucuronate decarboxylase
MLGLAKRSRAKILQASTSEVYGYPAVLPPLVPTGARHPIGVLACYDEASAARDAVFR